MAVRRSRLQERKALTEVEKAERLMTHRAGLREEAEVRGAKRKETAAVSRREFERGAQTSAQRAALGREYVRGGRKPPPTTPEGGVPKRAAYLQRKRARQQTLAKFRRYQAQQEGIKREERRPEGKGRVLRPSFQLRRGGPTVEFAIPEFGAKPTADTLAQAARLRGEAGLARREFDITTGRRALERAASSRSAAEPVTRGLPPTRAGLATPQISAEGMADIRRMVPMPPAPAPAPTPTAAPATPAPAPVAAPTPSPVAQPTGMIPPQQASGQDFLTRGVQAAAGGLWQGVSQPYQTAAGLIPQATPPPGLPPTMPSGVPPTQAPWLAGAPAAPPAGATLTPDQIQSILASPNPEAAVQMLTPAQVQQMTQMVEGQFAAAAQVGAAPVQPPFAPTAPQAPSVFLQPAGEQPMARPDLFAPRTPVAGVGGEPLPMTPEQRERIEIARGARDIKREELGIQREALQAQTGERKTGTAVDALMTSAANEEEFGMTRGPFGWSGLTNAQQARSRVFTTLSTTGLTPEDRANIARAYRRSVMYADINDMASFMLNSPDTAQARYGIDPGLLQQVTVVLTNMITMIDNAARGEAIPEIR